MIRLATYTITAEELKAQLAARGFKLQRNARDWTVTKGREGRTLLDYNGKFSTTALEMFWANRQLRFSNKAAS